MRKLAVLALAVLAASCSGGDDGPAHSFSEPDTLAGEFSYVYGYLMAEASADYGDIDFSQIIHGVSDFASSASDFSAAEMNDIMARYQQQLISEREAARAALAGKNRKVAEDFLAVNGQRMGVVTLPSGMQYEVLGKGDGESAADASVAVVDYTLTLPDGAVADSSYDRRHSSEFSLDQVIPGFAEAIRQMDVGDRTRFWIPPDLGYGDQGTVGIDPGSLLIFDIELISIE